MQIIYNEVKCCRLCKNKSLIRIANLGEQFLTGVFPRKIDQFVHRGPLELVKCDDISNSSACGLVQLRHSYPADLLYDEGYGYRSSLNKSMVSHLSGKVLKILGMVSLEEGDVILDIGSNDGTLLNSYPNRRYKFIGVDPLLQFFQSSYFSDIKLVSKFFSANVYRNSCGSINAKIITAIAMFYDLEDPLGFFEEIHNILHDKGIFVLELSYMPKMLSSGIYDTICHEHVAYYGIKQIQWIAQYVGLDIVDFEFNDVNGGSVSFVLTKMSGSNKKTSRRSVCLENEMRKEMLSFRDYEDFQIQVNSHKDQLCFLINKIKSEGKKLVGCGASTKGNVLLQFCGLTTREVSYMIEINKDKIGSYTPGSLIPIVSEEDVKDDKVDYKIVLPWHFRRHILGCESSFLSKGGRIIFPFPKIEIV